MEQGTLILSRVSAPITEPVTKFGGLPVWVDEPAWPRSRATGEEMLFIGQVVIGQPLFPVNQPRVAYLFITEATGELETWDPKSGENAVLIQIPSTGRQPRIIEGPRLSETYWAGGVSMTRPIELSAEIVIESVSPEIPMEELSQWDENQRSEYLIARAQKIGGAPDWIQADEMPEGWRLLLQMHDYPWVDGTGAEPNWNFGTGNCYVMVSPDFSEGILVWQC